MRVRGAEQLTQIGEPDIRQWFGDAYRLAGGAEIPEQVDEALGLHVQRSAERRHHRRAFTGAPAGKRGASATVGWVKRQIVLSCPQIQPGT